MKYYLTSLTGKVQKMADKALLVNVFWTLVSFMSVAVIQLTFKPAILPRAISVVRNGSDRPKG
jgi:hypothetical protein